MLSKNKRRLLLLLLLKKRQYNRQWWVRPILKQRILKGEFHNLIAEMRLGDAEYFFAYFRMTATKFEELLTLVACHLKPKNTRPDIISPAERLAITLRFLATGDAQQTISFNFRVGRSTICSIVARTCEVLWLVLRDIYMIPPNEHTWRQIITEYWTKWNFPNCCGAIDGKHCIIQAPKRSGSLYFNYKGTYSINLMAVADANYCFVIVDIGAFGKQSDGGVFNNSKLYKRLEAKSLKIPNNLSLPGTSQLLPTVFLGDEAFPLKPYLMRPFPGKNLSFIRSIYNYRLSRARRVIENAFGILSTRWRILRRPMILNPQNACAVIKATCVLHNFLMRTNTSMYCPESFVDCDLGMGKFSNGEWRNSSISSMLHDTSHSNRCSRSSLDLREKFANYFLTAAGKVEWQENYINRLQST